MNNKVIQAILHNDADLKHLLRESPDIVSTRMKRDVLIKSIHWLYVGDTALHLAAAAQNIHAAKLLLKAGADANAENRRRATPCIMHVMRGRHQAFGIQSTRRPWLVC